MASEYSWCGVMAKLLEKWERILLFFLFCSCLLLVIQSLPLCPQHSLLLFVLFFGEEWYKPGPAPLFSFLSFSSFLSLIQDEKNKKKLSLKEQMSSALVFCGGFILFY